MVFKIVPNHFFFFIMGNRNPPIRMQAMDVILSPACTSSDVEELCVGVSTSDVGESRSLSDSCFFNGRQPCTASFEAPA